MYQKQFVACMKCNGQVLREMENDTVILPFGSEYSILLKNLSTKRALVKIQIDGDNVSQNGIIISANEEVEIERYVSVGSSGYKFKFIERTEHVEKHRGIKPDDGLVRIEYSFEKPQITIKPVVDPWPHEWPHEHHDWTHPKYPSYPPGPTYRHITSTMYCNRIDNVQMGFSNLNENDAGITVEGSDSNQQFVTDDIGNTGQSEVIIFKLKGRTNKKVRVNRPITTTTKIKCKSCGRKHNSGKKYCDRCGTRLVVK